MVVEIINQLLLRDLQKLKQEIDLYKNENKIWCIEKSIANSAGNLCLHLVGNLNTYIGSVYGKTGYIRNRDLEFSQKGLSRSEILKRIDDTIKVIELSFKNITDDLLKEEYPLLVWETKTSTAFMFTHLTTHLSYHLGQVNYHRRLLDS